jgi:hypothetical protein
LALIVKKGTTEPMRYPLGQLTDTHSLACALLTEGSVFVADLL